jgi:hypothetical protein
MHQVAGRRLLLQLYLWYHTPPCRYEPRRNS